MSYPQGYPHHQYRKPRRPNWHLLVIVLAAWCSILILLAAMASAASAYDITWSGGRSLGGVFAGVTPATDCTFIPSEGMSLSNSTADLTLLVAITTMGWQRGQVLWICDGNQPPVLQVFDAIGPRCYRSGGLHCPRRPRRKVVAR